MTAFGVTFAVAALAFVAIFVAVALSSVPMLIASFVVLVCAVAVAALIDRRR